MWGRRQEGRRGGGSSAGIWGQRTAGEGDRSKVGGFLECAVASKEVSVAKLRGQVGKE